MAEQSFANHVRWVPAYHYFIVPVMTLNFGWSIYRWKVAGFSVDGFISIVVALALLLGFLTVRLMALSVQDRVIRLEERLRLAELLPESTRMRIGELSEGQLIALRFASDAEVPGLVQQALVGNWDQKQIKSAIQNWRPDFLRV